jgi:hypothetical protein
MTNICGEPVQQLSLSPEIVIDSRIDFIYYETRGDVITLGVYNTTIDGYDANIGFTWEPNGDHITGVIQFVLLDDFCAHSAKRFALEPHQHRLDVTGGQ